LQGKYRVILTWLLAMVWVVGSQAAAARDKQEQAELWVHENYHAILDLISRDTGCAAPRAPGSVRWTVCVLVTPGYQKEPEYLLLLVKRYDGTAYARITRPQGPSIFTQLLKLKTEHLNASATELAKLIDLETREGDQQTFPALLRLSDKFEKIRLSPVLSDVLMMDATTYFVHAKSSSGEQIDLVLYGPGPSAPHQPCPVLEWVEEARRVFSKPAN